MMRYNIIKTIRFSEIDAKFLEKRSRLYEMTLPEYVRSIVREKRKLAGQ